MEFEDDTISKKLLKSTPEKYLYQLHSPFFVYQSHLDFLLNGKSLSI